MSRSDSRNLAGTDDVDLIRFLAGDGELTDHARMALGELYRRYGRAVFAHCKKLYGSELGSDDRIDSFVGQVFLRFRRAARKFNPAVAKDPAQIRYVINAWFEKHARYAMRQRWRDREKASGRQGDRVLPLDQTDSDLARDWPRDHEPSMEYVLRSRRLESELGRLSKKDLDVILTSFRHWNLHTREFELPREEQERLMKRWGFNNPNSLVKHRSRLLESLRNSLNSFPHVA